MSYIVLTDTQRTPEWIAARLGRLTSSVAHEMMATIKSGEAAARRNLRTRLVLERLTGVSQENGYVSPDMQNGIDREADALAAYEAATGALVRQTGFLAHPTLMAGCSPDGLVGEDGGIELKCRKSANHLEVLRTKQIPNDARWQMLHSLWITGATWWDYVDYDDRFPAELRLLILRKHAFEPEVEGYRAKAEAFLAEVDAELAAVQQLQEGACLASS